MANTRIQVKRTSVSGRTPNTTDPANTQYIAYGELAINAVDRIIYSANASNGLITFGAVDPTVYTSNAIFFPIGGALSVGNTSSNLTVNNTGVYVGNTTANAYVFSTGISVSNTTSNSTLTPQLIFVGNTTSNAQMNMGGGITSINLTSYALTATGVATVNTQVNHGILLTTGFTVKLANVNALFNDRQITVTALPAANQISFAFSPQNDGGNALKISALSRSAGVATVNTVADHNLSNGWVVGITGTQAIDGGRFETSTSAGKTITVLTSNSFTIPNQSADVTKSVTAYSVAAIGKTSAGNVTLTLTSTSHGFSAGNYVTLSGWASSLLIGGITYTPTMLNTKWLISSVTLNSFSIILRRKSINETAVASASGSVTVSALRSFDFSQVSLTTAAFVTPVIPTTALTAATSNATFTTPVHISVANSSSAVKVTPSTIYVGGGTQTVVIDAVRGQRFNAVGSILQTSVDGSGFKVASLQSNDGVFDESSNTFFANASLISIGNSTIATSITPTSVQSNVVFAGDNNENVSINSTSLAINYSGNQAIISSTYASFPYSVLVGGHISVTGTLIDSTGNTANSTYNILYGNDSSVYWGPTPASGGTVTVGNTAPGSPSSGTLWWNSDQGTMKIYYDDGTSTQWVDASRGTPGPTGPMYGSRLVAAADATSITPNANTTDMVTQLNTQAAGTLTINAPTGSPSDGQKLMFRIKSTNIQTLSWNAVYAGGADLTLPSATSGSSLTDYYGFIYNTGASKWHLLSKISGF